MSTAANKKTVVPRMVPGVASEATRAPQPEPGSKAWSRLAQLSLVVLLLLLCPKISFASGNDPDTTKYALNDPRNPDCPCHAAQKLADEEYRKLQQQQDHNPVNVAVNTDSSSTHTENPTDAGVQQNANAGVASSGVSHHVSKSTSSQKMMRKFVKKMKARRLRKNTGTKKGNHRLATCFHFN